MAERGGVCPGQRATTQAQWRTSFAHMTSWSVGPGRPVVQRSLGCGSWTTRVWPWRNETGRCPIAATSRFVHGGTNQGNTQSERDTVGASEPSWREHRGASPGGGGRRRRLGAFKGYSAAALWSGQPLWTLPRGNSERAIEREQRCRSQDPHGSRDGGCPGTPSATVCTVRMDVILIIGRDEKP